jgi:putative Holliday junction resolvase
MRLGARVAFDVGKARIGVAVSDTHGILSSTRPAIKRTSDQAAISEMKKLVLEHDAIEIYVGLPLNLKNLETESTQDSVQLARQLAQECSVPVFLVDERMTTKIASSALRELGKDSREQRKAIDSAAAALILDFALEQERRGQPVGVALEQYE